MSIQNSIQRIPLTEVSQAGQNKHRAQIVALGNAGIEPKEIARQCVYSLDGRQNAIQSIRIRINMMLRLALAGR